jgi:hypothetical protein
MKGMIACFAAILILASIQLFYPHKEKLTVVYQYGDEPPGIGGTPSKPDTALCYVIPGTDTIFVKYLNSH